ncbi:MAG: helix-turn-helix domain-containing protein [Candidatus Omnitrophota bacterium]|nr:helix-turn-helix domain-containing protein [Candidatus Omnitrophota bacterium]
MPEKLISIKEVAEHLKISEEEVKRLVDAGEIPAYRIGGTFLRFRKEQIDAIRAEILEIEKKEPERAEEGLDSRDNPPIRTAPFRDIKRIEPLTMEYDYTPGERIKDFFYFNDFYILSFLAIIILLYLILKA